MWFVHRFEIRVSSFSLFNIQLQQLTRKYILFYTKAERCYMMQFLVQMFLPRYTRKCCSKHCFKNGNTGMLELLCTTISLLTSCDTPAVDFLSGSTVFILTALTQNESVKSLLYQILCDKVAYYHNKGREIKIKF